MKKNGSDRAHIGEKSEKRLRLKAMISNKKRFMVKCNCQRRRNLEFKHSGTGLENPALIGDVLFEKLLDVARILVAEIPVFAGAFIADVESTLSGCKFEEPVLE